MRLCSRLPLRHAALLCADPQPGKRRSASLDLPAIPERQVRRSLEGNRWSLPSEDSSRPSDEEMLARRSIHEHKPYPLPEPSVADASAAGVEAGVRQPSGQVPGASYRGSLEDLSQAFKRPGRRERRVARRSEAIDRAFAQVRPGLVFGSELPEF